MYFNSISNKTLATSMKEPTVNRPPLWLLLLEGRFIIELGMYFASTGIFSAAPRGDGHPVMVIPGFMTDKFTTIPLRQFLIQKGYAAYDWGLGRNLGDASSEIPLIKRVKYLKQRYNKNVSLIGWSLGGVYAREVARLIPEDIRQVITLASPFAGLDYPNNAIWMYEIMNGEKPHIEPELLARIKKPIDVPSTAIYSKTDGIVPWQACLEPYLDHQTQNIEIVSSHWGFGHNPSALMCIADRLAQPEDDWRHFDTAGFRKYFYYLDPQKKEEPQKQNPLAIY